MARLVPARRAALSLVSRRRRQGGRIRDIARNAEALASLGEADRALAFRLALGATAMAPVLDQVVDGHLKRPSSLEPRVRDALLLGAYELCYLDTPAAVAVSQGVEMVRKASPRAAGLANAVLRKIAAQDRPAVAAAYARVIEGGCDATDLVLTSGLPSWLVERVLLERGDAFARGLCMAQREGAPVYVATNGLRHDAGTMSSLLDEAGLAPCPLEGMPGAFRLGHAAPLAATGLVDGVDVVVSDLSAQLVCRIAAPDAPCEMLEVGQGRGTKSVLLATALGAMHPSRIEGVDSVAYKVRVSQRRMEQAGLAHIVGCYELDGCALSDDEGLPDGLDRRFGVVLVDAPCSGTGTMRRHPEIAASLSPDDVQELAGLQMRLLRAASVRVAAGGALTYSTCSVLREEDEEVVAAFLASDEGRDFGVEDIAEAPACVSSDALRMLVADARTPEGFLLTRPAPDGGDGHFCVRLVRRG